MAPLVTLTRSGQIATLTLNRPDLRNALSEPMLREMLARLAEAQSMCAGSDGPRVMVVRGEGKAFCAGMDLKSVVSGQSDILSTTTRLAEAAMALRALPIPVISEACGAAIGGGCGLACVADFILTHDDAKLGFPEVDLGACPAVVAPWVIRRLGHAKARHILMRGGLMSGTEAAAIGLVTRSLPTREAVTAEAASLCATLVKAGPMAMAATKRLLNELDGSLDRDLARRAAELSAKVFSSPEAQERIRARMAAGG